MPTSTRPIGDIARELGLAAEEWLPYGRDKAKVLLSALHARSATPDGKLALVTAITPTPPGDGKTTMTIGLGQALARIGSKPVVALREPSIGPTLGMKGGGTGGGRSQVVPMEDINLHFTGDFHAVTTAHNLLAAAVDSHLHHGNALGMDVLQVVWRRVLDVNDRALRNVVVGLGGRTDGVPREAGFLITSASEIMAALCLAEDLSDLKARLGRMVVALKPEGGAVLADELKVTGAMAAKLGDICLTEAGFGTDLGAEKFFDIKCRLAGLRPDAAMIVAAARALKYHGGVPLPELGKENLEALTRGLDNLEAHVACVRQFKVPVLVGLNRFATDTVREHQAVLDRCATLGVPAYVADVFGRGGEGGEDLARGLLKLLDSERSAFAPLYPLDAPVKVKLETIATRIYGADGVDYRKKVDRQIAQAEALGYGRLPVCVAKTQRSLSDDPALLNRPRDFRITINDLGISAGAGFLVALAGDITTMPGLPRKPNAEGVDVTPDGVITGLF